MCERIKQITGANSQSNPFIGITTTYYKDIVNTNLHGACNTCGCAPCDPECGDEDYTELP